MNFIIGYFLPLVQLIILAILIRRELKRPKAIRNGLAENVLKQVEKMERRMAKIGFIIVLVFIICQTPQGLNWFFCLIDSDKNGYDVLLQLYPQLNYLNDDWIKYFLSIAGILTNVNSCVNFIIYFMHGGNVKEKIVNFCC